MAVQKDEEMDDILPENPDTKRSDKKRDGEPSLAKHGTDDQDEDISLPDIPISNTGTVEDIFGTDKTL